MRKSTRATKPMMSDLERFTACMEYELGQRPNHELGVWGQTRARWEHEAQEDVKAFTWDWFVGEPGLGLDHREYVPVDYGFIPPFEHEIIEETEEHVIARNGKGIVTKARKEGTTYGARMSRTQLLRLKGRAS